jgi:hypothetical protein
MKKVSVVLWAVAVCNAWEICQPADPSLNPNWGSVGIAMSIALFAIGMAFWASDSEK